MSRIVAIVALSLAAGLRGLEASVQFFLYVLAAASDSRVADYAMLLLTLECTTFGLTVAALVAVTRRSRSRALTMCAAASGGLVACLCLELGPMRESLLPVYVAIECVVMLVATIAAGIRARSP
jgi:hypothetical protein